MKPLFIDSFTATTCTNPGNDGLLQALNAEKSGLTPCNFDDVQLETWIGRVSALDTPAAALPQPYTDFDCRNNRLAWLGLQQDGFDERIRQIISQFGGNRVGLFLGTSTSGIYETELAYRNINMESGQFNDRMNYSGTHSISSLSNFIRSIYAISGPGFVISTACSSSAKVFAAAQRFLELGLIDAALVGGVDSLCLTTLYGFNSLQLTSDQPCKPYDPERNGISIGEAAAFALLTKKPNLQAQKLTLLGYGESSDAYHMSSPHPEGRGAQQAMSAALLAADLKFQDIDYINLHGTSTPSNDRAEGTAVNKLFGNSIPCSSTKGITGHTLGAAGAVEAIICCQSLLNGFLPGSVGTSVLDPEIDIRYLLNNAAHPPKRILSNSFGFGGSNCSLVFGIEP